MARLPRASSLHRCTMTTPRPHVQVSEAYVHKNLGMESDEKDVVRAKWVEKSINKPSHKPEDEKIGRARKEIVRVINWELNDTRHRKREQIKDTVVYLKKILNNVRNHAEEQRYRRIRIANETFRRHVRDAPGGEAFMLAAGWRPVVDNHERYFEFHAQVKDEVEWSILVVACEELEKLDLLLDSKLQMASGNTKEEAQQRRQAVLLALQEDRQDRQHRFPPG